MPQRRDRTHWIAISLVVGFLGVVAYQLGSSIVRHQISFVAAERTEVSVTVLDEGMRYKIGRNGSTEYYPLVEFADGRRVEAEERIPRADIPPRGQKMTLACDTATLTRCRKASFWGVHGNLIGLTLLLVAMSAGPIWAIRTIVHDVRRRRAGPESG